MWSEFTWVMETPILWNICIITFCIPKSLKYTFLHNNLLSCLQYPSMWLGNCYCTLYSHCTPQSTINTHTTYTQTHTQKHTNTNKHTHADMLTDLNKAKIRILVFISNIRKKQISSIYNNSVQHLVTCILRYINASAWLVSHWKETSWCSSIQIRDPKTKLYKSSFFISLLLQTRLTLQTCTIYILHSLTTLHLCHQ